MKNSPEKILSNQLISNQKINSLLDLASDYVECGPECQKNTKSEELYEKYLKSQNISKMIPDEIEENKKKYYVYTYGNSYYENIKKEELLENVSEIMNDIKNEFNSQLENITVMYNLLQTTDPDLNCSNHYPLVQHKLNNEFNKKNNRMMVNDRETYYTSESIDKLKMWEKFLIFIYYFVVLIFLILCFPKTLKDFFKYGLTIGGSFFYIFIINYTNLFIYDMNKHLVFY